MGKPYAIITVVLSVLTWTSASAGILSPSNQAADLKSKTLKFTVMKPGSALSTLGPVSRRSGESPKFQRLTTVRQPQDRKLLNARLANATPDSQRVIVPMALVDDRRENITPQQAPRDPVLVFSTTTVVATPNEVTP